MNPTQRRNLTLLVLLVVLSGIVSACTSDSPTKPKQENVNPPGTTPPNAAWNITVTADPSTIELSSFGFESSLITVRVTSASTGQVPPNDSTVTVTTTLGTFDQNDDDVQATVLSLYQGQATVNFWPRGLGFSDTGTAVVEARLEQSRGSAEIRIIGAEDPFLSHVSPSSGRPEGGYIVSIHGGGFEEAAVVKFDQVPAIVHSVESSVIRVEVPAYLGGYENLPATVAVQVDVGVGTPNPWEGNALENAFTYAIGGTDLEPPTIFSISPNQGPNSGGYQAVIRGVNFDRPSQVFFGNDVLVEATITSISSNRIVVIVPPATGFGIDNSNEVVDVVVRGVTNGLTGTLTEGFIYGTGTGNNTQMVVSSLERTSGPIDGGTRMSIFGFGFSDPIAVDFIGGPGGHGVLTQQVISVSENEIVIRTAAPAASGCGNQSFGGVRVRNLETGQGAEAPIRFDYQDPSC